MNIATKPSKPVVRSGLHVIPPITDVLGRHWGQPDRARIFVSATHAYMTEKTFHTLADYSTTRPSGVYPGKMWRTQHAVVKEGRMEWTNLWWLMWFGDDGRAGYCTNNRRTIVIMEPRQ